jgi:hypothetical protein
MLTDCAVSLPNMFYLHENSIYVLQYIYLHKNLMHINYLCILYMYKESEHKTII